MTERDEPIEVVHIAGPTMATSGIRRQRCIWCGALIQEYDLANISRPLEPGEDPENPEPWEPGSFEPFAQVAMAGVFPAISWVVEPETHPEHDGLLIPDRACFSLDAEVTR